MHANPCASESSRSQLSNALGFMSNSLTVAPEYSIEYVEILKILNISCLQAVLGNFWIILEQLRKLSQSPDIYDKICQSIAPNIFGHEDVKKAIACLMLGGSRKHLPGGTKLRGDINVLLLG